MAYKDLVLSVKPANLIQYIPMDDASGTVATDISGNARNGVYTVCTLDQVGFKTGEKSVLFDGISSWIQLYSAALNAAFNPDEFTMSLICKSTVDPWGSGPLPAGRWSVLQWFNYDENNFVRLMTERNSLTLAWEVVCKGVSKVKYFSTTNTLFTNKWVQLTITGSKTNNQLKYFLNGVQIFELSTYDGWDAGNLVAVATSIGYAYLFTGYVSHFALWNTALTNSEISLLADSLLTKNMVVFGDSITVGIGASDAAHSYSSILSGLLNAPIIINKGVSGTLLQNTIQNTISTIGSASDNNGRDRYISAVLNCNSDYIFILYGLNDLSLNDELITLAEFTNDLEEIIAGLINGGVLPDKIILGSPTFKKVWSATAPFNIGTEIKRLQYASAISTIAYNNNCIFADIGDYLKNNGGDTLISDDNIHPNDLGHAAIAQCFYNAVLNFENIALINFNNSNALQNISQYIDVGMDVKFKDENAVDLNVHNIILNTSGYVNMYGKGYAEDDTERLYLSSGKIHNFGGINRILSSGTDKGIGIHVKI